MDPRKLSSAIIALMLVGVGFSMIASDSVSAEFIVQLSGALPASFTAHDTEWNAAGTMAVVVGYDSLGGPNAYVYYALNDTYFPIDNGGHNGQALYSVDYYREEVLGWPDEVRAEMDIGPHDSIYSSMFPYTRGCWFTAPCDFAITGLRVPTEVGLDTQVVEVVRLNAPPSVYPTMTNDFASLGYWNSVTGSDWIECNIDVQDGDVIGILGARGTGPLNHSYGATSTYSTEINGLPVTLARLGMQHDLYSVQAQDLWTESGNPYTRIEMEYSTYGSGLGRDGSVAWDEEDAGGGQRGGGGEEAILSPEPRPTTNQAPIPWFDDMEGGTVGWTTVDISGNGVPWHLTATQSYSPSHSWWSAFDPPGDYANGLRINCILWTPLLDFTGINPGTAILSFQERYQTELSWDWVNLVYSSNSGLTWNTLRSGVSGTSAGYPAWVPAQYAIPGPYSNQMRIGFHFDTTDGGANNFPGWLIDDVDVTATYDVALSPGFQLGAGFPSDDVDHILTVTNEGLNDDTYDLSAANNLWPVSFLGEVGAALNIGPFVSNYSNAAQTRGYWFTAPCDFTITALRVPTDVGLTTQNIQVLRFNVAPPSNSFTSLGYWNSVGGSGWMACDIDVHSGEVIGVLGARGTTTMYNSYGESAPYATQINGIAIQLNRLMFQKNLNAGPAISGVDTLNTNIAAFARIEMEYTALSPVSSISVLAGQSEDFVARVSIPAGALPGDFDVADIYASSQNDPVAMDTAQVRTQVPLDLPWSDDMEGGQGAWLPTTNSPATTWQLGDPSGFASGPGAAYSPSNCWGTNLLSNYGNDADSSLVLPIIDTTGHTNVGLSFRMWFNSELTSDAGWVEASTDGSVWNAVTPVAGPSYQANIWGTPGYTGNLGGWSYAEFDLSGYSGGLLWLRFRFMSDVATTNPGWYIDNVRIADTNAAGLAPLYQMDYGFPSDEVDHILTVTNEGLNDDIYDVSASNYVWPTTLLAETGAAMNVGPHAQIYTGNYTRGLWFTAPCDFTITALRVPLDVTGVQNIEVMRFNSAIPTYAATTNDFVSLGYWNNIDGTSFINCNIQIHSGEIIGILGARGTTSMQNSYGDTAPYNTLINGYSVPLYRLGMQFNLWWEQAHDIYNTTGRVGRVEMEYSIDSIPLAAGQSKNFLARVSIPAGASPGNFDIADIHATSRGDPLVSAMAQVETRVPSGITGTVPADLATGVLTTQNVVITFGEPMLPASVTYACTPNPGGWGASWNSPANTVLTLTHAAFAYGTPYTFEVTGGTDIYGNPLMASVAPNPWTFTTVAAASATATGPTGATNLAGVTLTYTYTGLPVSVNLYYTTDGGTSWNFAGNDAPVDGSFAWTMPSPGTYGWIAQAVGGGTAEPSPPAAGTAPEASPYVYDITSPTLLNTNPSNGATGVSRTFSVVMLFSEAIDRTSFVLGTSFTINPNPGGLSVAWSLGDTMATITHNIFDYNTLYTCTVTNAVTDVAGNPLAAGAVANPWSFTTVGASATATGPSGRSNVADITLAYTYLGFPTSVNLYYSTDNGASWTLAINDPGLTGSIAWTVPAPGTYHWLASAVGGGSVEPSPPPGGTAAEAGPYIYDTSAPAPPTDLTVTWAGGPLIDEDFTDAALPSVRWAQTGPSLPRWTRRASSFAGGTLGEAQFEWVDATDVWRLHAGPFDTTGLATLDLQFRQFIDSYATGSVTLKVQTSSDLITWNDAGWSWLATVTDYGPVLETLALNTVDVGSGTFYVAWVVDGYAFNIDYWFIDDVLLTYPGAGATDHNQLDWTLSADDGAGSNDVHHYNIYRADTEFGAYSLIGNVPAGTSSYMDYMKGEPDGINWWYIVRAVDIASNEEMNTNAVPEILDAIPPTIISTTPVDSAGGVAIGQDIIILFSEEMNTGSVTYSCNPDPGGWSASWNSPTNDRMALAHNPFTYGTTYTFTVTAATDLAGNPLAASAIPNPWSFTTIAAASATATGPTSAGPTNVAGITITYTYTGVPDSVNIYYTTDGGTSWALWGNDDTVDGSYGLTLAVSGTYGWIAQAVGGGTTEPSPPAGGTAPEASPYVFDNVSPTITSTDPTHLASGIGISQDIIIFFSEAMATGTVTYTCNPDPGGWMATWGLGDTRLGLSHNPFAYGTTYTFTVTAASDVAGNPLAAGAVPNPWTFTTIVLATATATGPVSLTPTNVAGITITYTWTGSPTSVNLYYTTNLGTSWTFIGNDGTVDGSYFWAGPPASGTYHWLASAVGGGSPEPSPPPGGSAMEAGPYVFDNELPSIITVSPASGAINVQGNANIIVTFSEPMDTAFGIVNINPNPGGIGTYWSNGDKTLTIIHDNFPENTNIVVTLSDFMDLAGNVMDISPYSWDFTTTGMTVIGYRDVFWIAGDKGGAPAATVYKFEPQTSMSLIPMNDGAVAPAFRAMALDDMGNPLCAGYLQPYMYYYNGTGWITLPDPSSDLSSQIFDAMDFNPNDGRFYAAGMGDIWYTDPLPFTAGVSQAYSFNHFLGGGDDMHSIAWNHLYDYGLVAEGERLLKIWPYGYYGNGTIRYSIVNSAFDSDFYDISWDKDGWNEAGIVGRKDATNRAYWRYYHSNPQLIEGYVGASGSYRACAMKPPSSPKWLFIPHGDGSVRANIMEKDESDTVILNVEMPHIFAMDMWKQSDPMQLSMLGHTVDANTTFTFFIEGNYTRGGWDYWDAMNTQIVIAGWYDNGQIGINSVPGDISWSTDDHRTRQFRVLYSPGNPPVMDYPGTAPNEFSIHSHYQSTGHGPDGSHRRVYINMTIGPQTMFSHGALAQPTVSPYHPNDALNDANTWDLNITVRDATDPAVGNSTYGEFAVRKHASIHSWGSPTGSIPPGSTAPLSSPSYISYSINAPYTLNVSIPHLYMNGDSGSPDFILAQNVEVQNTHPNVDVMNSDIYNPATMLPDIDVCIWGRAGITDIAEPGHGRMSAGPGYSDYTNPIFEATRIEWTVTVDPGTREGIYRGTITITLWS